MQNNIVDKQVTFEKLLSGINQLANAVKTTSGSKGKTFLISKDGKLHITKDGVTIAHSIRCADPLEQLGVLLLQEVAKLTVEQGGDGTTGVITMAQALAQGIASNMDKDAKQLLKEIEVAQTEVLKLLQKEKRRVKSLKDCVRVATIATNNDTSLGNLIGEVVWAARENGVILFEESDNTITEVIQEFGSRYDKTYDWKLFLGSNQTKVAYENPLVYIYEHEIEQVHQIEDAIKESFDTKKPLVVFAKDYSKFAITELSRLYNNGLKILPLVIPGYGNDVYEFVKDIKAISANDNIYRIVAERFSFILYTNEVTPEMEKQSDYILHQIGNEPVKYVVEQLERRLSTLNQKVFTVHVGAPSEVEMKELKDRIEDGLLATRSAYEDGYVLGGGTALRNVAYTISQDTIGKLIIKEMCLSPFRQILKNADIIENMELEKNQGWDTNTGLITNFERAGIYDSYRVIKQSFINACSVIKTIVQLNGTIFDMEQTKKVQFVPNEGFKQV